MRAPTSAEALYALASTLALAAFVHIAVVWLIPHFAEHDAFSAIRGLVALDQTIAVSSLGEGKDPVPYLDPATPGAACRYDLSRGPARVTLPLGRPAFLSLSFHADNGVAFFALTDRAASAGKIEAVLVTPEQLKILEAHDDEENPSQDLRIVAPTAAGFAFARALAETPGLTLEAQGAVNALVCRVDPLPG